ncbi:MAG: GTP 3',8-cyclase MoaA [Phycisphaeraceae bacterium]
MFQDAHARRIGYLRLSLTKACAMRCTYCRPATLTHPRGEAMLSADEIDALVRHLAANHGLHKVRLTGGDPTSRPELTDIIRRVAGVPGITDLAMTTNGLTLPHRACEYAAAGLHRINLSLDTLDPQRFARLTGVDGLARVLAGLDAAEAAGLAPIRINTVVVRDQNERDLPSLVRFAASRGFEVRFIELMPMGPLADQWADRYVPEAQMRARLDPIVDHWQPLEQGHDAARRYRVTLDNGQRATVGFITPMSCNFCAACNRIRVAADGVLYPCLMDEPAHSLLPALRPRFDADHLDELIAAGLAGKRAEHPHDGFVVMTHIGG